MHGRINSVSGCDANFASHMQHTILTRSSKRTFKDPSKHLDLLYSLRPCTILNKLELINFVFWLCFLFVAYSVCVVIDNIFYSVIRLSWVFVRKRWSLSIDNLRVDTVQTS